MAKKITSKTPKDVTASELVYSFFQENNIELRIEAVESVNQWLGDGYVLNDKPLLKVSFEYK